MRHGLVLLFFACARLHAMPCEDLLEPNPQLQAREILRVEKAFAVSAPALTADRQGNVLAAYVNDEGEIPVYALTQRSRGSPFPVWRFPTRQMPFSGANEFVRVVWHINSEGTPVLFVYWIPAGAGDFKPRTLYRAMARLHDETVHVTPFNLPAGGFFEDIHSLNFGQEFVQWTYLDGRNAQLVDFNLPARILEVHDTFHREALLDTGDGRVLAARVTPRQIEIMHYHDGRWLQLWAAPCDGTACDNPSLHTTGRGEVWLAHTQADSALVAQNILRPETRHERRFNQRIGDPPKFFEAQDGRLLIFVDLEKGGEFTRGRLILVNAFEPKSLPRTLTPEAIYFLESSRAFSLRQGQDHFLGLVTQGGLELLNISVNARTTYLGRIAFDGTQRVSWLASPRQQIFAVIPHSPEAHLVLFELLSPLAEKR